MRLSCAVGFYELENKMAQQYSDRYLIVASISLSKVFIKIFSELKFN